MIKIAYHPIYAHPLPEGHRFPMIKYELIPEQLLHEGLITTENIFNPAIATETEALMGHTESYWEQLKYLALPRQEQRRIGFPLTPRLLERELRIVQGTIDGALNAVENHLAFNVAGGTHHAGSNWGEGFCLLNDQAIAANYLLAKDIAKRILIIDLDVHQGNGTAEIFKKNTQVFTFSMHGEKNFPFRKERSSLDIPLPDGVEDDDYLNILDQQLKQPLIDFAPDFVFYQAGVDVLATDKLGKLNLSLQGCKERDIMVMQWCKKHGFPLQISMGGGYSVDIRVIVNAHCNTFKQGFEIFAS